MKHNLVLKNMQGNFYGMQPGPNHTLVEVYCGTLEASGEDLEDCLTSAVLYLQDYHGNPAPCNAVYVSDVDSALYYEIETLLSEVLSDTVCN